MITQHRRRVIGHHLILSGYGFWLANDPRGSGSDTVREGKFAELGPIHYGRKNQQPSCVELRAFYEKGFGLLEHPPLWFNEATRQLIGEAFGEVIGRCGYTVWACFVGSNHGHVCVRYHRDDYETIWNNLTGQSRVSLAAHGVVSEAHPVWAPRPYSVFLYMPDDIRRTIKYIEGNAAREGLPRQVWSFVREYDGWPAQGK